MLYSLNFFNKVPLSSEVDTLSIIIWKENYKCYDCNALGRYAIQNFLLTLQDIPCRFWKAPMGVFSDNEISSALVTLLGAGCGLLNLLEVAEPGGRGTREAKQAFFMLMNEQAMSNTLKFKQNEFCYCISWLLISSLRSVMAVLQKRQWCLL